MPIAHSHSHSYNSVKAIIFYQGEIIKKELPFLFRTHEVLISLTHLRCFRIPVHNRFFEWLKHKKIVMDLNINNPTLLAAINIYIQSIRYPPLSPGSTGPPLQGLLVTEAK